MKRYSEFFVLKRYKSFLSAYPSFSPLFGAFVSIIIGNLFFDDDTKRIFTAFALISSSFFFISKRHVFWFLFFAGLTLMNFRKLDDKIYFGYVGGMSKNSFYFFSLWSKQDLTSSWKLNIVEMKVIFDKLVQSDTSETHLNQSVAFNSSGFAVVVCKWIFHNVCFARSVFSVREAGFGTIFSFLQKRMMEGLALCDDCRDDLILSLAFGQKATLPKDIYHLFAKLGINHLLAVSGFHFGICIVIFWFLSKFFVRPIFSRRTFFIAGGRLIQPRDVQLISVFIFSTLFLFASGFPVSARRAWLMLFALIFSKAFFGNYNPLNSLFFASSLILAFNPFALWDVSFQLSFSATLFIILAVSESGRNIGPIEGSLLVSAVSSFGTLPFILSSGMTSSFLSPVFNLLFSPLFALSVAFAVVGAFVSLLLPELSIPLFWSASKLAEFTLKVAHLIPNQTAFSLKVEWAWLLFPLFLIVFLLSLRLKTYLLTVLTWCLSVITPIFLSFYFSERFFFTEDGWYFVKRLPEGWAVVSRTSKDFESFCSRFECVCAFAVAENVDQGEIELCYKLAGEYIR